MKEIIINSKKYGQKLVLVDDEDYEELSKYTWYLSKGKHTLYVLRDIHIGMFDGKSKKYSIAIHRHIMKLQKGDKILVDHIDGDGLNNQRSNLRLCTVTENNRNQIHSAGTFSSVYKGVYWDKSKNTWAAEIRINKKKTYLGRFKNEKDAAIAYDLAAIKHFGEFACLNFDDSYENIEKLKAHIDSIRKLREPKTSKYVGISLNKRDNKWAAIYKSKSLGLFSTELEAYNRLKEYKEGINENN